MPARLVDAKWPVKDGYFEVGPGTGPLVTRDKFGDIQLHIEWAAPPEVKGTSQGRGNSGVLIMGLYEIQVLDTYNNPTYADGHAGSDLRPMAAAGECRAPAGRVADATTSSSRPRSSRRASWSSRPYQTVFWNGVFVHNRKEVMGPMVYRQVAHYTPARGRAADRAAGPQQSGAVPERLGPPPRHVRRRK